MIANVVKAMYEEGYTVRQCSLIAGCSYDYVLKIIKGERGGRITASVENMTDTQLERKKILDILLSLRGSQFVDKDSKYAYFALLGYLGFKDYHIVALFPFDNIRFIRQATHYSNKAWQKFDSTVIGMPQEQYEKLWMTETRASKTAKEIEERDPNAAVRRLAKKERLKNFKQGG